MTNSGLLGLKITIAGAAFFLGGCLMANQSIGILLFVAGALIMLVGVFAGNRDPEPEKKDDAQQQPKPMEEKK